ncbi:MAG: acetylxylan esterase [Lentisphaeria bacterium]|nr:acetylxylan esterase [Lentisphaeria bacterium]
MEEKILKIFCNKKTHLCRAGEIVEFTISGENVTEAQIILSIDGEAVLSSERKTLPAKVKGALPFPGFLRCCATADDGIKASCGVGVEPENILSLAMEPDDFDLFWENTFREFGKIPASFRKTFLKEQDHFHIYQLEIANLNDQKAYGMLAIPEIEKEKEKVPLLVNFPGGEAFFNENGFADYVKKVQTAMKRKTAVLLFQLPPYPPQKDKETASAKHQEFLQSIGEKRYVFYGLDAPEHFYARSGICGCVGLLKQAAALPEIDRENIFYHGLSHGGAFGLFLACFSGVLKRAFCGVPDFGDVAGFLAGRHNTDSMAFEFRKNWQTLLYFDTSFCAKRITIPVMIGVGFTDELCPPTGVYAIYNALQGEKCIYNKIHHGHSDAPNGYDEATWTFLTPDRKTQRY